MTKTAELQANQAWAFRSALPHMQYAFKTGKVAKFQNNLFYTTVTSEYEELKAEVDAGHPFISIDANEPIVELDALTPAAIMEKRIRAKIMAEMAANTALTNNMGNYDNRASVNSMLTTTSVAEANQPVVVKADANTLAQIAAVANGAPAEEVTASAPTASAPEETAVAAKPAIGGIKIGSK